MAFLNGAELAQSRIAFEQLNDIEILDSVVERFVAISNGLRGDV